MKSNTCPYCKRQCITPKEKLKLATYEFNVLSKKNSQHATCISCGKELQISNLYHLLPFVALAIFLLFSKLSSFITIGLIVTFTWILTFLIFYLSPFKVANKKNRKK